jgi:hypothetical protein
MVRINVMLLLSLAILLISCEEMIVKTEESKLNVEDFNAAWERVNTVYPYLELKKINWDSLYLVYKPMAEQAKGDEIYSVLIDMLGELKDMHASVGTEGGRLIETYHGPRWLKDKYSYNPIIVRNYFDRELKIIAEGNIEYEIIPGNIGYIYIGSFNVEYLKDPFNKALSYVKDTKALILDIRHNNGGSTQHVESIVNRFITSTLEKPESYLLGELIVSTPFKPQGPFQYINPVVVLINGVCVSAGDYFPEVMKQISMVTIVGDTTAGASAGASLEVPAQYELPSGKKVFIGTLDMRRYDGLPWEWIGVAPDILVEQTREDLENGKDKQLEYAIKMLKD